MKNLVRAATILISALIAHPSFGQASGCCKTKKCCEYVRDGIKINVCYFRYMNCFVYELQPDGTCELIAGESNCMMACQAGNKKTNCGGKGGGGNSSGGMGDFDPGPEIAPWTDC